MGYGSTRHVPVLANEAMEILGVAGDGWYCDATAGGGGFSQQFIDRLTSGRLVGFDRDGGAVAFLRDRWKDDERVVLVHTNFSRIAEVWREGGWPPPRGIVYDLGFSSIQLEDESRGLSFQSDSPLDMRLDPEEQTPTAADIVNTASQEELERLFWEHGELGGRPIAKRIVREREVEPIETTGRLAAIVASAAKKKPRGIRRPRCFSR